jgi:diguanylate cyclase (GGDEF)-like protein
MMLDIDHFKDFNDTYGHDAGDQVLVALGRLLRLSIRQSDIACRYGGEEFVIILPGANAEDGCSRAEIIRAEFGALTVEFEARQLSATISVGVALYPLNGASPDELLRAADAAMYDAKSAGRNIVCLARK